MSTVVAPAGYGKTTALAQWAERDGRRFAWVTVDERDNDPVVFLRHIVATLDRDEPVQARLVDALRSASAPIWTAALPRLAAELSARGPIVLVLDDFNLVRSRSSLEAISALAGDERDGLMLVLAGRAPPRLRLAPLRAAGALLELGWADLAMSKREAQLLLRAIGVRLSDARVEELVEQCEGWAAGLYLAALSIRDGAKSGRKGVRPRGDDRYLADYFRSEYLSQLRPGPLRFLRRVSVLDRMSGALCDAVLDDAGSARELEKIERANLFLVPLDEHREWYRYHHLFRDLLQRELRDHEPELIPTLHGRAADWFKARGDDESAFEHAYAAGETDRAASILAAIAFPLYRSGRVATLERLLTRFERARLVERYPAVALHGCRIHALRGRIEDAERWLEAAGPTTAQGSTSHASSAYEGWAAVLRAWLCRTGAEQMLVDATVALDKLPESSEWIPSALLARGAALLLLGDHEQADDVLAAAAARAAAQGSTETRVVALGERALLAAERGDHAAADGLCGDLFDLVHGLDACQAYALEHAVRASMMLRHGRWNEARAEISAVSELRPLLNAAVPWLAVQVQLELVRGEVTLRNAEAARKLLDEIDEILRVTPGMEALVARAGRLQEEVDGMTESAGERAAGFTPAELRLLPLLATHLSFREIAVELFVSRNTIKTQAISIYRKLGVSSRSEAIAEANRLGLGEHLRVLVATGGGDGFIQPG